MMRFIEYTCYYLYTIFINRGKLHDNAKIAAVAYVAISIFFYIISPFLFLRFSNLNLDHKYAFATKVFFICISLCLYLYFYFKIERERSFLKIITKFKDNGKHHYSKFLIWIFVFGGFICFVLSILIIAIISNK